MTTPIILGPITPATPFLLVSVQGNQPYVLSGTASGPYYWQGTIPTTPTVFQGGVTGLVDLTNGGRVGFATDLLTVQNTTAVMDLHLSQSLYQPWTEGLLSRAPYTLSNGAGATARIAGVGATGLIPLPTTWYYGCHGGAYSSVKGPVEALTNWFSLVRGGTGVTGWTNLTDCETAVEYNYCYAGSGCGQDSCRGPCPVPYDRCVYGLGEYSCELDFSHPWQWWRSRYFLPVIIGAVGVILILLVVALIMASRERQANRPLRGFTAFTITG